MGDGINDAAAMKSADIGISVDTAVDIAKESADIILLEKDLMVLEQGIIEGRKTYANMIKYIKMTASSNFGNMFSVLAASALLPFLPMESVHLILLNLIYDLSCTDIPWDNVDEEFIAVPRKWEASSIGNFMIWIGPTSSIFDWTTYAFLYFVFCPRSGTGTNADYLCGHVPCRVVCGIHVEPDAGDPHDPNPETAVYPEPRLGPGDVADLYRHRGTDGHPLYRIGKNARICRPPRSLFCLPDPLHFVVYGVGDQY